ncbi:hypothetical protein BSFA1_67440 (plasmid) [Burkholderia sp. SFA1]|nr:hypothetical protein BSFA1_67440 [Burkholderia sp. SFA1]
MAPAQRYALPLGMQGKPIGREAGRNLKWLYQYIKWRDVTDRARSKPDWAYEGTL